MALETSQQNKFSLGDRVKVVQIYKEISKDILALIGATGEITELSGNGIYEVTFDKGLDIHSCHYIRSDIFDSSFNFFNFELELILL